MRKASSAMPAMLVPTNQRFALGRRLAEIDSPAAPPLAGPPARVQARPPGNPREPDNAHAWADRRDELGKHGHLLPPPQRARLGTPGRSALRPAAALVVRLR